MVRLQETYVLLYISIPSSKNDIKLSFTSIGGGRRKCMPKRGALKTQLTHYSRIGSKLCETEAGIG